MFFSDTGDGMFGTFVWDGPDTDTTVNATCIYSSKHENLSGWAVYAVRNLYWFKKSAPGAWSWTPGPTSPASTLPSVGGFVVMVQYANALMAYLDPALIEGTSG